jgi:hypothetical protein
MHPSTLSQLIHACRARAHTGHAPGLIPMTYTLVTKSMDADSSTSARRVPMTTVSPPLSTAVVNTNINSSGSQEVAPTPGRSQRSTLTPSGRSPQLTTPAALTEGTGPHTPGVPSLQPEDEIGQPLGAMTSEIDGGPLPTVPGVRTDGIGAHAPLFTPTPCSPGTNGIPPFPIPVVPDSRAPSSSQAELSSTLDWSANVDDDQQGQGGGNPVADTILGLEELEKYIRELNILQY